MIILFSSKNIASANIAKHLIEEHGFSPNGTDEWKKDDIRLIDTKVELILDVPTDFETDCLVVLSTHKSKNQDRMLTAHIPGNWGKAEMGGESEKLNIAAGSRLKILFQEIAKEAERVGWKSSIEADHHGPTCEVPIIFVEIGTTETEWRDEEAGKAIANAVVRGMKRNETYETVFGVGGGHYPRLFTRLELESALAFGHMLPKYSVDTLTEDMFRQAIVRNAEKVAKVIISKDEVNARQREKIIGLCGKFGVKYELM